MGASMKRNASGAISELSRVLRRTVDSDQVLSVTRAGKVTCLEEISFQN
jgi:hypothetical protein